MSELDTASQTKNTDMRLELKPLILALMGFLTAVQPTRAVLSSGHHHGLKNSFTYEKPRQFLEDAMLRNSSSHILFICQ
jgi:hypothetical protein